MKDGPIVCFKDVSWPIKIAVIMGWISVVGYVAAFLTAIIPVITGGID